MKTAELLKGYTIGFDGDMVELWSGGTLAIRRHRSTIGGMLAHDAILHLAVQCEIGGCGC